MDRLSQDLFSKRDVVIEYSDRRKSSIKRTEVELFGRKLKPRDYADLVGTPSGATILLDNDDDNNMTISVMHPLYDGAQIRALYKESGQVFMINDYFVAKRDAPKGLGSRVLARQVKFAYLMGVRELSLQASGGPSSSIYNGYYTWPRLGFIIDLSRKSHVLEAAGFSGVKDTADLFKRPGGKEWWRTNGWGGSATFDLQPGSRSHTILSEYLAQKGIVVDAN